MNFPSYEALELATRARNDIFAIWSILVWIAIPLSLLPPFSLKWKWIFFRAATITLIVWPAILIYRLNYTVPWTRIWLDLKKEDWTYDGLGGNAAIMLMGWIFPFIMSLGTLSLLKAIVWAVHRVRNTPNKAIDSPPSARHH